MSRAASGAGAWPLALACVGALLFASTMSGAVQEGQGGALITAACTGEGSAPPGGLLYTWLGMMACELPWFTAAGRLALLSAGCALLCMLLVFGLVCRCTGNAWAGGVAALTLATGDIFWREASHASLIPLALALCLGALYYAVRGAQASSPHARGMTLGAGLCVGLAAGIHPAALVAAPFCLLAAVRPLLPLWGPGLRLLFLAGGAGLGFAISGGVVPWSGPPDEPLSRLGQVFTVMPAQLGGVLWPLSVLGLGVLGFHAAGRPLGRPLRGRLRRDLAALLAALPLLAGPGLVLVMALKEPLDPDRLARPHLALAAGLLCVSLGVGLALLDASLIRRRGAEGESGHSRGRARLWHTLALVVIGIYGLVAFPRARLDNDFLVEDSAQNSLTAAERGSTLLVSGGAQRAAFSYVQKVLRQRPDVRVLDPAREGQDPLRLIQNELRQGRNVQITEGLEAASRIRNAFGVYPAGPLLRIQPPDRRPPSLHTVQELNTRLFRGFSRRGRIPHVPDPLRATELLEPYARAWRHIGRSLLGQGQKQAAFKALLKAQRWAPWLETPAWFGLRKELRTR